MWVEPCVSQCALMTTMACGSGIVASVSVSALTGKVKSPVKVTTRSGAEYEYDVLVLSWVRADRARLDVPLSDAVARWIETDWPWQRVERPGR